MNDAFNSAFNSCVTQADQSQSIDISGITGSSIIIDADWSQQLVVSSQCLATNNFTTNLANSISQEAEQIAKSVNQQFALGTFAGSQNLVQSTINLSNTIKNIYTNQCQVTSEQIQNITIQNTQAQLITADSLWTQTLNTTSDCVFNNTAVTSIQNQIQQEISQSASSEIQNYLEGALLAVAAIIGGFGIVLFGFGSFLHGGSNGQGATGGNATETAAASAVTSNLK